MQPLRLPRGLIRVSGPDARAFLDNLLTQDLAKLDNAPVVYAALLSPQGKVSADMFVWNDGDGLVLDVDPSRTEALARKLGLYKLRAQITIEDISTERAVLVADAVFDGAATDPRFPAGAFGWRALGAASDAADGAAWFETRRLALGVPDLARDAGAEEVFGLEALLEELHGVDFKKGCFVGQENVSRMKRRATTRKKFCPIAFEGPAPAFGTPIMAGEVEIGGVRTGGEGRAMALLRLDRAQEAAARAQGLSAGGVPLRLAPPEWLLMPAREAPAD